MNLNQLQAQINCLNVMLASLGNPKDMIDAGEFTNVSYVATDMLFDLDYLQENHLDHIMTGFLLSSSTYAFLYLSPCPEDENLVTMGYVYLVRKTPVQTPAYWDAVELTFGGLENIQDVLNVLSQKQSAFIASVRAGSDESNFILYSIVAALNKTPSLPPPSVIFSTKVAPKDNDVFSQTLLDTPECTILSERRPEVAFAKVICLNDLNLVKKPESPGEYLGVHRLPFYHYEVVPGTDQVHGIYVGVEDYHGRQMLFAERVELTWGSAAGEMLWQAVTVSGMEGEIPNGECVRSAETIAEYALDVRGLLVFVFTRQANRVYKADTTSPHPSFEMSMGPSTPDFLDSPRFSFLLRHVSMQFVNEFAAALDEAIEELPVTGCKNQLLITFDHDSTVCVGTVSPAPKIILQV